MNNVAGATWRFFPVHQIRLALCALALAVLSGCASHYIDGNTKRVDAAQFRKPAQPAPVQLFVEFESKGVANARATEFVRPMVQEQVQASGLFSQVQTTPADGGALLEVKLNNIPVNDDAFSKGFVTGLTFGLAGSQVSDGYVCTVRYLQGKESIEKTSRHAIHTTLGNTATPGNATKAQNLEEAVRTVVRQVLSTALNDLSHDPKFP